MALAAVDNNFRYGDPSRPTAAKLDTWCVRETMTGEERAVRATRYEIEGGALKFHRPNEPEFLIYAEGAWQTIEHKEPDL